MSIIVKLFFVVLIISLCASLLSAQASQQDVLYLKNGSIIRGTIIEFIPDKTVKIQTADSSLFVFASSDIEKILKEDVQKTTQTSMFPKPKERESEVLASLFGGVAIPGSDLADGAQTGFTVGFQLQSRKKIGILANFSYSSNPGSEEANVSSFIGVIGVKVSLTEAEKIDVFLAPLFGFYLQRISVEGNSISGSSFAYGGMIGCQLSEHLGFGVKIVGANPSYENGGYTFKLSTSMFHIFIAVGL
jgi:hypothetical protein